MQLAAWEQQQPAYHTQRWGTQLNCEVRWHANLHKQKQTRNPSWGRTGSDYWQKQRNTDISFSGFQSSRDKVLIKVIFSRIRVVQSSPISWMCAQAALCWVNMTNRRRAFSEALLLRSIPLKMPMFWTEHSALCLSHTEFKDLKLKPEGFWDLSLQYSRSTELSC